MLRPYRLFVGSPRRGREKKGKDDNGGTGEAKEGMEICSELGFVADSGQLLLVNFGKVF